MKKIAYRGPEIADTRFHDGALAMVDGACHIQVMRANREHPELSQGTDFTYNHAPMICRWHGMLYLLYLSSPVHEHDGFARALLMHSPDGFSWSRPEVIFPEIDVPQGIYCGRDAEKLPANARTVIHHRMGFFRAANDVLLVMTHHGVSPHLHIIPNSGYGMGRVVRRIRDDGALGEIYLLRVNTQAGWRKEHFPYPWFGDSDDAAFVAACHELLQDHAANGAWWEEERLDEDFFPLKGMRAPSFCPLPDGNLAAIGKVGVSAISEDGGKTWSPVEKAEGIISSGGKCCITRTGDGRYAIVYNPSPDGQHRWPLAIITGEDGYTYDHMYCAGGEVAPMRYGGYLKNFGLNYIRTIMPGNDDAPDGYTWMAYSMNKEDIWVLRLPREITAAETQPVDDDFSRMQGEVPEKWHIYRPQWAKVALEEGCLTLHDSEPWDYAKAMRNFPEAKAVTVHTQITAQGSANGVLHLELSDRRGMNAGRVILGSDGQVYVRAGDGQWPVCQYADGETLDVTLQADCTRQQLQVTVNGKASKAWPLMCPVLSLERLTLRTGDVRTWPTPEDNLKNVCLPDYANPGDRLPEAVYRVAFVEIR